MLGSIRVSETTTFKVRFIIEYFGLTNDGSGIGPSKELIRNNIPQIVDLPVGENLSDHPCSQTFWKFKDRNLCLGDTDMVTASCDWRTGSPCDWFAFHRNKEALLDLACRTLDGGAAAMYTAPGKSHFESFVMYPTFYSFK